MYEGCPALESSIGGVDVYARQIEQDFRSFCLAHLDGMDEGCHPTLIYSVDVNAGRLDKDLQAFNVMVMSDVHEGVQTVVVG
jgi:hypothetical protein